ncbi:MAG: hypothetical protein DI630_00450 [Gordonia sp. (in: high G+C Gram-positive bacteria)]|nr:MAG: hypothetical protein DI630_00450 [Gordonia sp. (in: high G+C Gram-positive bacteria)]
MTDTTDGDEMDPAYYDALVELAVTWMKSSDRPSVPSKAGPISIRVDAATAARLEAIPSDQREDFIRNALRLAIADRSD